MSYVVTLGGYTPGIRYDGNPWTSATIGESATSVGPFTTIDTFTFSVPDADPSNPKTREFTTANAQLSSGWYLVTFLDAHGNQQPTTPVPYPPPGPQAMPAYCSVLDVQSRNAARPITPSSLPNIAQVQQYIADTSAEINGILVNKQYLVPIISASSPVAFSLLHSLAVTGAHAITEAAAQSAPGKDAAARAWEAAKKMLGDAKFVLPDAPQDQARAEPRGPYVTARPSGHTFDPMFGRDGGPGGQNPADPYFSRQMRF